MLVFASFLIWARNLSFKLRFPAFGDSSLWARSNCQPKSAASLVGRNIQDTVLISFYFYNMSGMHPFKFEPVYPPGEKLIDSEEESVEEDDRRKARSEPQCSLFEYFFEAKSWLVDRKKSFKHQYSWPQLQENKASIFGYSFPFTVQRALPWPPNKLSHLTTTCKVRQLNNPCNGVQHTTTVRSLQKGLSIKFAHPDWRIIWKKLC